MLFRSITEPVEPEDPGDQPIINEPGLESEEVETASLNSLSEQYPEPVIKVAASDLLPVLSQSESRRRAINQLMS